MLSQISLITQSSFFLTFRGVFAVVRRNVVRFIVAQEAKVHLF